MYQPSLVAIPAVVIALVCSRSTEAMTAFMSGMNTRALIDAMWEPVICVGFCPFLLVFFRKHLNKPGNRVLTISTDSYTAYILQPLIVVAFAITSEHVARSPVSQLA
jgi:glucans biosynthesis protein C